MTDEGIGGTMMLARRLLAIVVAAVISGSCVGGADTTPAAESTPPFPAAPEGWQSVGGLGGSAQEGFAAGVWTLSSGPVALHATCAGYGDLVVAYSPGTNGGSGPESSVLFPCGGAGTSSDARVEPKDLSGPGPVTVRATVIEEPGTTLRPSFEVSIEQPAP